MENRVINFMGIASFHGFDIIGFGVVIHRVPGSQRVSSRFGFYGEL